MLKSITDRNILFGIFALQMGFITRDALVLAMKTWVLNKNKFLSQILQEQDALAPDTFELLEALVKKHLAMHGNDAGKSLAAVSSLAGQVLEELQRISDSEVQHSLAQAGTDATIDLVPPTTVSVAVGSSSSRGLRFRILRPHAKGGLGLVYVAHDEELNRDVALKEIQDRHADHPESRSRFMLEAEITGGLEHPGIVPVYGLGQYADGRPFYAMRFIRGDSLKDAIATFHKDARPWREKTLELRELLERLIDVCNAMQYAHDRGILHRDLKPGNIMLGKYGETLVVDWGLAKPMGAADPNSPTLFSEPMLRPSSASGSAATMQGSAVGTPQYMSPEQAAGRLDQLGPASDIYSLGATLYSLLTGKAPFDIQPETGGKMDLGALLARVQAGEFRTPRQLNSEINPPLEAICLKAMAKNPQDRYATPRALIDDIKHWLADEPVSAWPEPWTVKTRRWVGKHRTLVTGVAAALIVGVVSLSVATVLLAQANEVIQKNNNDLTDANKVITKQNEDIKKEVAEKEKQRKLAEARLKQSLDAVGLFANDARKYCEDAMVPGESRRRLYEVLTTQLERQVDQEPGEASIDSLYNKAWMYQTLCAVTHDFGEYGESKKWFDKGLASAAQWEKIRPGDPLALSFRAAFLNVRGRSLTLLKQLDEARRLYTQAMEIRRKLVGDPDVDLPAKVDAISSLADSLDSVEQFEESLVLRSKVVRHFAKEEKKLEFNTPPHKEARQRSYQYREALCSTYQKAALHASDYAKRKQYLIQADKMSEQLLTERRTNRNALLRWSQIAKILGELEYNLGKLAQRDSKLAEKNGKKDEAEKLLAEAEKYYAEAKKHFAKLNELSRKLATSDELVEGVRDYSRSFYTLGLLEDVNGRPTQARKNYEKCREIRELTLHDYQNNRMSAHLQIDLLFAQIALGELRQPMELVDNMVWVFKEEPDAEYRLACIYSLAINTIEETRKPNPLTDADKRLQNRFRNEAIRCLQFAHDGGFGDFFHTSIDADLNALRDDPRMKEFEATHQYRLGVFEKKRGEAKKARNLFEKSQTLAQEWIKSVPGDRRQGHARIVWLCAQVQLGKYAEAIKAADELYPTVEKNRPVLFRLARVYSLASAATDDARLQEQYRAKALAALDQAAEAATEHGLMTEEDLDPIRDDPRFRKVLERAKAQRK